MTNKNIISLSDKTLLKIYFRIDRIKEIYEHLDDLKKNIPSKEYEFSYGVYFIAIATLYRSLFKGLDKSIKLNIADFNATNEYINEIHNALIRITDQDNAHLDKKSQSHYVVNIDSLKKGGSTTIVTSLLSEDQLKKMMEFLEARFLPLIQANSLLLFPSAKSSIYLDHASATPLDPRVATAMQPFLNELYGNPSSLHTAGQKAKEGVDRARRTVAGILGASAQEIIFTGGGTESNNLALLGIAEAYAHQGKHIITSAIEHESVLEPLRYLEKERGFKVTFLPVDREGKVKLEALEQALTPQTILVSIMMANNEVGTIQPIREIAKIIKNYALKNASSSPTVKAKSSPASGAASPLFHTDACQAAGVLDLNVKEWGIDLLTLNGSKIYGPKGVGMLYVRNGVSFFPQIRGGGQERKRRAGTENVPAIVGLAEALRLAQAEKETENTRLTHLRERFIEGVQSLLKSLPASGAASPPWLNGHPTDRLPNNIHFTIPGIEGETLLLRLDMEGVYASAGSACTAGSTDPSHVLLAMGISKRDAYGSVRFSLGRSTTQQDVDRTVAIFARIVKELQRESGV